MGRAPGRSRVPLARGRSITSNVQTGSSPVASSRAAKAAKNPRDYPAREVHERAQCDGADNSDPKTPQIVISPARVALALIDRERVGHSARVIIFSAEVDVPAGLIGGGLAKRTCRADLIVLAGGIGEVFLNGPTIIPIVKFCGSLNWPPADEPQSKAYAAHEPEALPAIEPCKSTCHRGQALRLAVAAFLKHPFCWRAFQPVYSLKHLAIFYPPDGRLQVAGQAADGAINVRAVVGTGTAEVKG
jgi:hypothetical protein